MSRVIKVISLWVSKGWSDFSSDPQLRKSLDDFIADIKLSSSMIGSSQNLPIQHLVDKIQKAEQEKYFLLLLVSLSPEIFSSDIFLLFYFIL
jgi:hypothetical protein